MGPADSPPEQNPAAELPFGDTPRQRPAEEYSEAGSSSDDQESSADGLPRLTPTLQRPAGRGRSWEARRHTPPPASRRPLPTPPRPLPALDAAPGRRRAGGPEGSMERSERSTESPTDSESDTSQTPLSSAARRRQRAAHEHSPTPSASASSERSPRGDPPATEPRTAPGRVSPQNPVALHFDAVPLRHSGEGSSGLHPTPRSGAQPRARGSLTPQLLSPDAPHPTPALRPAPPAAPPPRGSRDSAGGAARARDSSAAEEFPTYNNRIGEPPCPCLDWLPHVGPRGYLLLNVGFGPPIAGLINAGAAAAAYAGKDTKDIRVWTVGIVVDILVTAGLEMALTWLISGALVLNDFRKGYMAVLRLELDELRFMPIHSWLPGSVLMHKPLLAPEAPPPLEPTRFRDRLVWQLKRAALLGALCLFFFGFTALGFMSAAEDAHGGDWTPGRLILTKALFGFALEYPCILLTIRFAILSCAHYELEASVKARQHAGCEPVEDPSHTPASAGGRWLYGRSPIDVDVETARAESMRNEGSTHAARRCSHRTGGASTCLKHGPPPPTDASTWASRELV